MHAHPVPTLHERVRARSETPSKHILFLSLNYIGEGYVPCEADSTEGAKGQQRGQSIPLHGELQTNQTYRVHFIQQPPPHLSVHRPVDIELAAVLGKSR